ncbi:MULTISPECIES: hypothetical protein [Streptomyces]|uniref:hypothetical protein n=1 Tax=Streptomyces TaxID=1883 RepID=UPI0033FB35D5
MHGQIAGLAHDDQDLTEFLRRSGLPDAQRLLDQPEWVEWRGGRPAPQSPAAGASRTARRKPRWTRRAVSAPH